MATQVNEIEEPAPDPAPSTPQHASVLSRRRRVLLVCLVVLLGVGLAVVLSSGSAEPPATGAAALVPADSLAYVNVSVDPSRLEVTRALRLAKRFPSYSRLRDGVLARLAAIVGGSDSVDFARQVRPWLGAEAALAVLNTTASTAGSLIVLDVSDHAAAKRFIVGSGATPVGGYRGVPILRYPNGTALAFIHHYLAVGVQAAVRAAIDVASGAEPSLASDPTYRRAATGEPASRVVDAYMSAAGVRRVLEERNGTLGALGVLLDRPALEGVDASLSAGASRVEIRLHSVLDPALTRLSGQQPRSFSPSLDSVIPAGSGALLDANGLRTLAPRILQAGAAAGIAGQVGPLLRRLGAALAVEGVNVGQVLSIFRGETAVAVVPGAGASVTPSLVIVARTHDAQSARTALASLEVPLAQLFAAPSNGPGQAPEFNDRQVAGVTAHQLSLAPGLQLDYAVFGGLVIVSTSLDGIAAVARHDHALSGESEFTAAFAGRPAEMTSLLFLDFSQLLSLGEQTGLTRGAGFAALRGDLEGIRSVGLVSTGGEADTTAELLLQIS